MESDRPEHNEMPATAVRDVGEAPVASVASEAPQAPLRPGWKRPLSVFAACFIVYLAVLEGFLAVPQFNDIVQIRPASALGPVLGLFFGLPGVFGCATANLASDILHEGATPFMLAGYFVIQVMYNGLPRWVWYLVNARSPRPYPRFDSASKTALYMALALVDSVCVNLAVYLFVGASPESGPSFATRGLNNVWMLLYIGLPLLYALERSPLTPNPPRWIHVPYRNIKKANLTQRFVIWFVIASALLMLLVSVVVIAFASGDEESFQAVVRTMFHEVAILTVPIFLPMFVFLHILERRFTRPIEVLALDQQTFIERMESDVEQGRRDTCIAVDERGTKPRYEIAELYESTNKMRRDMVGFIERLYNVTAERQRTATELDVARQIQMSAVPHDFDSLTERFALDIAGFMRPAREVGGDFYDFFLIGDACDAESGKLGFVVADVSGKGVPAALFMMAAKTAIRGYMESGMELGEAFENANRKLCAGNDSAMFVTAFAGVLDYATGSIAYVNAGHNAPFLRQHGEWRQLTDKSGLPLGLFDGMPYKAFECTCAIGDELLLYTDGVTEAMGVDAALYGLDRLKALLDDSLDLHPRELIELVRRDVTRFSEGAEQADDITMLALEFGVPPEVTATITVPADDRELPHVAEFVHTELDRRLCPVRAQRQLDIALEELFVNVAHYAYPDATPDRPGEVRVSYTYSAAPPSITVEIEDEGIPFDPLSRPDAVTPTSIEDVPIGGLGILMAKRSVDEMRYERTDGTNVVTITKRW